MGIVYEALDHHLNRLVALKILQPDKVTDHARKQRFIQEAQAASALNHPNIITIHDIDEVDGVDYIAMELVRGVTLEDLLAKRRLDQNSVFLGFCPCRILFLTMSITPIPPVRSSSVEGSGVPTIAIGVT